MASAKIEKLLPYRGLVVRFRRLDFFAEILLLETGFFPQIDLRQRMIHLSKRFFFPDGGDPRFDSCLILGLQLIEIRAFVLHLLLLWRSQHS
jgi:hypothetical protein